VCVLTYVGAFVCPCVRVCQRVSTPYHVSFRLHCVVAQRFKLLFGLFGCMCVYMSVCVFVSCARVCACVGVCVGVCVCEQACIALANLTANNPSSCVEVLIHRDIETYTPARSYPSPHSLTDTCIHTRLSASLVVNLALTRTRSLSSLSPSLDFSLARARCLCLGLPQDLRDNCKQYAHARAHTTHTHTHTHTHTRTHAHRWDLQEALTM